MHAQFRSSALLTVLLASGLFTPAPGGIAHAAPPPDGAGSGSAVNLALSREQHWLPPLGLSLSVLQPFRAPAHRYAAGHRGFDLSAAPGAIVTAPVAGTVTFAGRVVDRDVVSVRVDATTVVSLEPVTSDLSKGDEIGRGALLGEVSRGGHCDESCVHLGVRVNDWYVNPMRFFRDKPVLLPWE